MKRGSSGLSLVVGIDKPTNMTSHDVVNSARRIFQERRIGHTGTLDPLASGVLPLCIGPATRLGTYFTGHDKRYVVRIAFGASTSTDDAGGVVIQTAKVPAYLYDATFAQEALEALVGEHQQLPPAYSAIKVGGQKAYEAARRGQELDLKPRPVFIREAHFCGIDEPGLEVSFLTWTVEFLVSKGTYIRSIARDLGQALHCPAHVLALQRTAVGLLELDECVSLKALEQLKEQAALDPLLLLNMRFAVIDDHWQKALSNGTALPGNMPLFQKRLGQKAAEMCACANGVYQSTVPANEGEIVAILEQNKLKALYVYDKKRSSFRAQCVFQKGVVRGADI